MFMFHRNFVSPQTRENSSRGGRKGKVPALPARILHADALSRGKPPDFFHAGDARDVAFSRLAPGLAIPLSAPSRGPDFNTARMLTFSMRDALKRHPADPARTGYEPSALLSMPGSVRTAKSIGYAGKKQIPRRIVDKPGRRLIPLPSGFAGSRTAASPANPVRSERKQR